MDKPNETGLGVATASSQPNGQVQPGEHCGESSLIAS